MSSLFKNSLLLPPRQPQQYTPPIVTWQGFYRSYEFQIWPIGTEFIPKAGLYVFCYQLRGDRWQAVYFGETGNFKVRLTDNLTSHHRYEAIRRAGATHIGVHLVTGPKPDRVVLETDLRRHNNPVCNRQ